MPYYYSPYWDDKEYPWLRAKTHHMFDFFRLKQNIDFPQFNRLPIELRQYVWEFFCPALAARSRLYELNYWPGKISSSGGRETAEFRDNDNLEAQTRELRVVMAVHRESRQFVQRVLPDTLSFGPREQYKLPFNKVNDVIFLNAGACAGLSVDAENPCELLEGVSDQIHSLAFDYDLFADYRPPLTEILCAFPNLQRIFACWDYSGVDMRELTWCVSDEGANFCQWEVESNSIYGKDYSRHHTAWPDLTTQRGRDYASTQVPLDTIAIKGSEDRYESWPEKYKDDNFLKAARDAGMDIWPMVEFTLFDGQDALDRLKEYASAGKIEGEDYDQDDWDRFHGWQGYLTASETSGDGFDAREDDESSTDDEDHAAAAAGSTVGSDDDDLLNGEPWFYNSVGQKVPESAIPPGSMIFYERRCPALPSESEDEGDEADIEDEVD